MTIIAHADKAWATGLLKHMSDALTTFQKRTGIIYVAEHAHATLSILQVDPCHEPNTAYHHESHDACCVAAVGSLAADSDLQCLLGRRWGHRCCASEQVGATAVAGWPKSHIVHAP